jgi:hypothetical protein
MSYDPANPAAYLRGFKVHAMKFKPEALA